jgi:hypothetical protein
VRYALKDVRRDPAALAEFEALGGRLPPLTVVDGVAVSGFDLPRLEALLAEEPPLPGERP